MFFESLPLTLLIHPYPAVASVAPHFSSKRPTCRYRKTRTLASRRTDAITSRRSNHAISDLFKRYLTMPLRQSDMAGHPVSVCQAAFSPTSIASRVLNTLSIKPNFTASSAVMK